VIIPSLNFLLRAMVIGENTVLAAAAAPAAPAKN
jgi:hypothetical protein